MKITERQQGWHGIAIRTIALLAVPLLLYVGGRLALDYVPSLGRPPCEDRDNLTLIADWLEAVLLIVGIWLQTRVFRHPNFILLITALLVPLAAWLIQYVANDRDALRQQRCAVRPLAEAMKACGANSAHYRREKVSGYDNLTVISPGTTDQAWRCLWDWASHNGTVSLKVDESVYREYRRGQLSQ